MASIQVRTTQNVFINYPVASIGDRIIAHLLDQLIRIVYAIAIVILFFTLEIKTEWIWGVCIVLPWLLYSLLFEILMNGQTPGKRVLRIQVIRLNGSPATVGDYILRWIFGIVDFGILSGAIAVIVISMGGKGQRLGDLVAGTSVVKLVEQKEITAKEIFVQAEEAYQPTFTQAAQLNDQEIEIIQRALEVNRDQGNPQPVLAVVEKIKNQFGIQTDLPPVKFLYVLIKDYNHFSSDGPAR